MLAILTVFAMLIASHEVRPDNRPRHATRTGAIITLHPLPISFRTPREWLDWERQFHSSFYLSRTALSAVEDGHGEWDTEYRAVVNSALPFRDCAAHVGGMHIELRAYITDLSSAEVLARFSGPGMDKTRALAHSPPKQDGLVALTKPEFTDEGVEGGWHKAEIVYRLRYYDYGGVARIRVYLLPVHNHTLALVFMGNVFMGNEEADIKQVLDSVTVNSK